MGASGSYCRKSRFYGIVNFLIMLPNLASTPDILVAPTDQGFSPVWLLPLERADLTQLGTPDPEAASFIMAPELAFYDRPDDAWRIFRDGRCFVWGIHQVLGEGSLQLVGVSAIWKGSERETPAVGVTLFRDRLLGSGIGSSAFVGTIECGYRQLNAPAVLADTIAQNSPCIKTLKNLGFALSDRFPGRYPAQVGFGREGVSGRVTTWVGFDPAKPKQNPKALLVSTQTPDSLRAKYAQTAARYEVSFS